MTEWKKKQYVSREWQERTILSCSKHSILYSYLEISRKNAIIRQYVHSKRSWKNMDIRKRGMYSFNIKLNVVLIEGILHFARVR